MEYKPTHQSKTDKSPAMLVSRTDLTLSLVNEDGFLWTARADEWEPIPLAPTDAERDHYAALATLAEAEHRAANERFQQARTASEMASFRQVVFTCAAVGVGVLSLDASDQGDHMSFSEVEPEELLTNDLEDSLWDGASDLSDYGTADWAGLPGVEATIGHNDDQITSATIDIATAVHALLNPAAKPSALQAHIEQVCTDAGLGVMVQVYEIISDRGDVDEATLMTLTAEDVNNHYYRIGAGIDDVERHLLGND